MKKAPAKKAPADKAVPAKTAKQTAAQPRVLPALPKAPTGIAGFDEVTGGGLPKGRPSLVCGSAGCGKTLFSMEFLVRGAIDFDEPGVFVAFEETAEDLTANVASLGFDLETLQAQKKLRVDHIEIEPNEIAEAGEYDLEGLFIRLGLAIDSIGAKRVVIDTLEVLFSSFQDQAILRAELQRLFRWLKSKNVTAIITAERGGGSLTRHGLEEYVSDCVLLLDHRVVEHVSTRRLRVVKYRGSRHGTNEYPFLINDTGFFVLPVTSAVLSHQVTTERISSGIPRLDEMLGGKGYYRGNSVLISGTAGSGKSTLSALFVHACCSRGERCLYFAYEESPQQIVRNMRSIGLDLQQWIDKGLLQIVASRPSMFGLEMHLAVIHQHVAALNPTAVIVDPFTNLFEVGSKFEVTAAMNRLIDFFKTHLITALFLSLTSANNAEAATDVGVSSLMDVWVLLRNIENNGERNRGLYILKARGTAHSNQIREFQITERGVDLLDVYIGSEGVLMGTARKAQEAKERAVTLERQQQIARMQREVERKRKQLEVQIEALRAQFDAEASELTRHIEQSEAVERVLMDDQSEMATLRGGNGRDGESAKSSKAERLRRQK